MLGSRYISCSAASEWFPCLDYLSVNGPWQFLFTTEHNATDN